MPPARQLRASLTPSGAGCTWRDHFFGSGKIPTCLRTPIYTTGTLKYFLTPFVLHSSRRPTAVYCERLLLLGRIRVWTVQINGRLLRVYTRLRACCLSQDLSHDDEILSRRMMLEEMQRVICHD